MATIAFQGFALKKNLSESELDIDIINNLGEAPIAYDVSLFYNNKRNTSSMEVKAENVVGTTVIFPGAQIVFSNYTPVTVNNVTYYVTNSNGLDRFQLSTNADLSGALANPPVGTYYRSDEITLENITNISRNRRNVNINRTDEDSKLSYTNQSKTVLLDNGSSATEVLTLTEANLDVYNFKRSKALIKTTTFEANRLLKSDGVFVIKDPDNRNSLGINLVGGSDLQPGMFIRDPIAKSNIRAFSSNDQPWAYYPNKDTVTHLRTTAEQITIGNLYFNNYQQANGIDIKITTGINNMLSTVANSAVTSFTHKIPMTVNGETYYLCLKK